MLMWNKPETLEGLTVYADDTDWTTYYVLPAQPRYRLDENGEPVFKFLKYRFPIERPDGKKGGGFLIFDVEFVVPEDKEDAIRAQLQERINARWKQLNQAPPAPPVKIAQWSALRATSTLQFLDSGGAMVEKIQNPGSPSLYGKFLTPFTVELSAEGATLAERALQDQGGVVQVAYDLWMPVKLPPVQARVWFRAEKFMEFHQSIDVEERFWNEDDYRETIHEQFRQSESGGVEIDPGSVTDEKVISAVRDWAMNSLEQAVTRMVLGDIAAQDPKEAQKLYTEQDIENISRDVVSKRVASFERRYKENQVMEWNPAPRGTLPNITTLKDKDGKPLRWDRFAKTVDLNDPFFRTLTVNTRANADFAALPLDSIEVKIEYQQGSEHSVQEYSLRKADEIGKFATFIANDSYKYKYSYQVNYKDTSQRYDSPVIETDERFLTVNVGDTGILLVDVAPGDLNFTQVKEAQVTLQYEDTAQGVPLTEQVFRLDKDHPTHQWVRVIFKPRTQAIRFKVKYFMENGREYETAWQTTQSPKLFINDPFSASRDVKVRGFGDFDNAIESIFVDLKYVDAANDYTQTQSGALTKGSTFLDWTFPVIDEQGGRLTYAANIRFKNGTVKEIAETEAVKDTIMLGDVVLNQEVAVMADLVDLTKVKLIKVSLHYRDEVNGIDEHDDLVFKNGAPTQQKWTFPYKDKTKRDYQWSASYFFAEGPMAQVALTQTSDETLVLPERPA